LAPKQRTKNKKIVMTIQTAWQWGYKNLQKKSTSASLDTEVLLSFVIKKPKEFLYTHPEKKITARQFKKINQKIKLRSKNWPIAYLISRQGFYGLDFLVDKNVLIPRPETELIVEEAIKTIKAAEENKQKIILIDIGTGSGCIPITIGKKIHSHFSSSSASGKKSVLKILATDISSPALKIARHNAQKHKIKIQFLKRNLLGGFLNSPILNSQSTLIITANLPYLTAKQMREKTIQKEPRQALFGGKDGLYYYQQLLEQLNKIKPAQAIVFLEIDPAQNKKIQSLIKKILPGTQVEIKKDLAKKDRLVIIKI